MSRKGRLSCSETVPNSEGSPDAKAVRRAPLEKRCLTSRSTLPSCAASRPCQHRHGTLRYTVRYTTRFDYALRYCDFTTPSRYVTLYHALLRSRCQSRDVTLLPLWAQVGVRGGAGGMARGGKRWQEVPRRMACQEAGTLCRRSRSRERPLRHLVCNTAVQHGVATRR